MMDMENKNKYGFTLVELLAVIVVLAIVMLIAVQSVLPRMEEARRQALVLDAQTIIEAAQSYYISEAYKSSGGDTLPTDNSLKCVKISTLTASGDLNLRTETEGYVTVQQSSTNSRLYLYKVYVHKGQLMINGAGSDTNGNKAIEVSDVKDFTSLAAEPTAGTPAVSICK